MLFLSLKKFGDSFNLVVVTRHSDSLRLRKGVKGLVVNKKKFRLFTFSSRIKVSKST